MKIFGIDFTSAPGPRKAITWLQASLQGSRLHLDAYGSLYSLAGFDNFLAQPGPWLAGLDFPFGQPRRLIENIGWTQTWQGYVDQVALLSKDEFVATLDAYRKPRPAGDKQHLRVTDRLAGARSPMMLYGVPVGKMFYEGAPRLLRSGVSILPCLPRADTRIAIEVYPALLARRALLAQGTKQSYKNDSKHKQSEQQRLARQSILDWLLAGTGAEFGLTLEPAPWLAELVDDPSGDRLDALLCAVQAAWAASQPGQTYGIPAGCDALEGWIVDPGLAWPSA